MARICLQADIQGDRLQIELYSSVIFTIQELLAFISLYMLVNLIYRELLVRKSECSDEVDNCRQVRLSYNTKSVLLLLLLFFISLI